MAAGSDPQGDPKGTQSLPSTVTLAQTTVSPPKTLQVHVLPTQAASQVQPQVQPVNGATSTQSLVQPQIVTTAASAPPAVPLQAATTTGCASIAPVTTNTSSTASTAAHGSPLCSAQGSAPMSGSEDNFYKIEDEPRKSDSDPSVYRSLELRNGLKVLLISDMDADKAAAALTVQVIHRC